MYNPHPNEHQAILKNTDKNLLKIIDNEAR